MYIYNPLERRMERLCALEDFKTEERYCSNAGTLLEDHDQALHLALGNINPFSMKRLDSWTPEKPVPTPKNVKRAKHKSIWQGEFLKENLNVEKKQTTCALFFKKVDFVSKTIDEDIEANQRLEEAKQTEAQVFTMYNFRGKRRRSPSREESVDTQRTPPQSPAHKSRHNPFAKDRSGSEAHQKSPAVCENGSLLRLLSPNKVSPLHGGADETRVNSLKRSIFAKEQVEVRSRFFGTQQSKQSEEQPAKEQDSNISQKRLKLQKQEVVILEEDRPSSRNSHASEADSEPALMECDETTSDSQAPESIPEGDEGKIRIKSLDLLIDQRKASTDSDGPESEAIILLSDDSCSSQLTPATSSSSSSITQRQESFPSAGKKRIGLSRQPSTAKKGTPKTPKKSSSKLGAVSQNQTKLSMFGFQRRPALK